MADQKLVVNPRWLKACGLERLEGVELKVQRNGSPSPFYNTMYEVETPAGWRWLVAAGDCTLIQQDPS